MILDGAVYDCWCWRAEYRYVGIRDLCSVKRVCDVLDC